jgi:hypothetical protein
MSSEIDSRSRWPNFISEVLEVSDLNALDTESAIAIRALKKDYSDRELFFLARKVSVLEEDPLPIKLDKLLAGDLGIAISRLPNEAKLQIGITAEDSLKVQIEKIKDYRGRVEIAHLDLSYLPITQIPIELLKFIIHSIDYTGSPILLDQQKSLLSAALANPSFKIKGFSSELLLTILEKSIHNPSIIKKILEVGFEADALNYKIVSYSLNHLNDSCLEQIIEDVLQGSLEKIPRFGALMPKTRFIDFVKRGYLPNLIIRIGPEKSALLFSGFFNKLLEKEKEIFLKKIPFSIDEIIPKYKLVDPEELGDCFTDLIRFSNCEFGINISAEVLQKWLDSKPELIRKFFDDVGVSNFHYFFENTINNLPSVRASISKIVSALNLEQQNTLSQYATYYFLKSETPLELFKEPEEWGSINLDAKISIFWTPNARQVFFFRRPSIKLLDLYCEIMALPNLEPHPFRLFDFANWFEDCSYEHLEIILKYFRGNCNFRFLDMKNLIEKSNKIDLETLRSHLNTCKENGFLDFNLEWVDKIHLNIDKRVVEKLREIKDANQYQVIFNLICSDFGILILPVSLCVDLIDRCKTQPPSYVFLGFIKTLDDKILRTYAEGLLRVLESLDAVEDPIYDPISKKFSYNHPLNGVDLTSVEDSLGTDLGRFSPRKPDVLDHPWLLMIAMQRSRLGSRWTPEHLKLLSFEIPSLFNREGFMPLLKEPLSQITFEDLTIYVNISSLLYPAIGNSLFSTAPPILDSASIALVRSENYQDPLTNTYRLLANFCGLEGNFKGAQLSGNFPYRTYEAMIPCAKYLDRPHQESLKQACTIAFELSCSQYRSAESIEAVTKKIQRGEFVTIPVGYTAYKGGHAVDVAFYKDEYAICNRGSRLSHTPIIVSYIYEKEKLNSDVLKYLLFNNFFIQNSTTTLGEQHQHLYLYTILPKILGGTLTSRAVLANPLSDYIKDQKRGNCSKASPLTAFKWYVFKYYSDQGLEEKAAISKAKELGSVLSYHMREKAIKEAEAVLEEVPESEKGNVISIIEKAKIKQPKKAPK